jgi:hypothetical protein
MNTTKKPIQKAKKLSYVQICQQAEDKNSYELSFPEISTPVAKQAPTAHPRPEVNSPTDSIDSIESTSTDDSGATTIESNSPNISPVSEISASKEKSLSCDITPACFEDADGQTTKFHRTAMALSQLCKNEPQCNAYVYGSAIYKENPGDLDILIPEQEDAFDKQSKLVNDIIALGGHVKAHYFKKNRHTVNLSFNGVDIDIIYSPGTSLKKHAGSLDFTIGAIYFDLKNFKMRQPEQIEYLDHLENKELVAISYAENMIENDPTVILRAARILATTDYKLSQTTLKAITNKMAEKNLFLNLNIDRLWLSIKKLFLMGNAEEAFDVVKDQLGIFEALFDATNTLRANEVKTTKENIAYTLDNFLTLIFMRNPECILDAIASIAAGNIHNESTLSSAIQQTLSAINPLLFIESNKLSEKLNELLCFGNAIKVLDILTCKLGIIDYLFGSINNLTPRQKKQTIALVKAVAVECDRSYANEPVNEHLSFSIFFHAIHYYDQKANPNMLPMSMPFTPLTQQELMPNTVEKDGALLNKIVREPIASKKRHYGKNSNKHTHFQNDGSNHKLEAQEKTPPKTHANKL